MSVYKKLLYGERLRRLGLTTLNEEGWEAIW